MYKDELAKALSKAFSMEQTRKSKYGNKRVQVDGHWFDSKAEAKRYGELKLLVKKGHISCLEIHPRFPFHFDKKLIFTYVADFRYMDHVAPIDCDVTEDIKGVRTEVYKLKKKLIEAQYGITITEVDA